MTDDEYRERYLARLVALLEDAQQVIAQEIAADLWAMETPRPEMAEAFRDNPELAAEESFREWKEAGRDDDDGDSPGDDWDDVVDEGFDEDDDDEDCDDGEYY